MRRRYPRLVDGNRLCRCGTGRFCHLHQIYNRTPSQEELAHVDRRVMLDRRRIDRKPLK
jgi:hypothetical protein